MADNEGEGRCIPAKNDQHGEGGRSGASSSLFAARNSEDDDEQCITSRLILDAEAANRLANPELEDETSHNVACCVLDGFGLKLSSFLLLLIFIYCNLLNFIDRLASFLPAVV
jgi:hypothetical protein